MKKGISTLILSTLICIAPYLWLIVDIMTQNYERLLIEAIMVFPATVILTLVWRFYLVSNREE